jgi:phosphohistidine phosphatase
MADIVSVHYGADVPRLSLTLETVMNLLLWRHAEAEDTASSDLARQLTPRGRKQALAVAQWLRDRLEPNAMILASPAARTVQTVKCLTDQYRVINDIAPGASVADVLKAAAWPDGIAPTVVIVGHQPVLGCVASFLMTGQENSWSIKKGGLWWLQSYERNSGEPITVRAVISPTLA